MASRLMRAVVARTARDDDRDLLTAILDELRAINAKLPARPAAADDVSHRELMTAIAAATRGLKFTVSELLVHAEVVADRVADQGLHDAIVAACGAVNGRQLGKLLARLEGREIDGLRVVRAGMGRDGITWRVAGFAG